MVNKRAYGIGESLIDIFHSPIIGKRAPTTADKKYKIGQSWINSSENIAYILTSIGSGGANWEISSNSGGAAATSLYVVSADGDADFETIQEGIDAANSTGSGGLVYIRGTYTEDLTLYDGITLVGEDENDTVITGQHLPPASGNVQFRNLKFVDETAAFSSAAAGTTTLLFEHCNFEITNGYSFDLVNWTGLINVINAGNSSTQDGFSNNTGGATVVAATSTLGAGSSNAMILSGTSFLLGNVLVPPVTIQGSDTSELIGVKATSTITTAATAIVKINDGKLETGASAAISHGSAGALYLSNLSIDSSNSPSIDGAGAGSIYVGGIHFIDNDEFAGTLTIASTDEFAVSNLNVINNIESLGKVTSVSQNLGGYDIYEDVVTVSAAEIVQLAASPKELVAAPGANKYIEFLGGTISLDFGTTAYDDASTSGDLLIRTGTTNTVQSLTIEGDGLIDAVADAVSTAKQLATDVILDDNESIELFNDGAEYAATGGGDSILKVLVRYRIVDLS